MLIPLIPLVSFDSISTAEANELLTKWGHRMGPLNRPYPSRAVALFHLTEPVCVLTYGCLIATHVGGGLSHITRQNGVELSRLCAVRSGLCRVGIRLWRDFVFPTLGVSFAISYQDADLHSGNTYRFDGWRRSGFSRSGTDVRGGGRRGRNKWIWVWPPIGPPSSILNSPSSLAPAEAAAS
jgi:antitoxin VapB